MEAGDFVAVLGPSGSGKSTLMNVIGLLARPDSGEYRLGGAPVAELRDDELARMRNRVIGFVFQSYHLLARMTAEENVWQPLLYADGDVGDYAERGAAALAAVGLAVSRVIRVRYGEVALGDLYRGASRPLSPAEMKALYGLAGMAQRGRAGANAAGKTA